ncbi:hypothetical protein K491DRAFT_693990 [Lophiostoma macrostomum CBS 122681]|uniref:F-box domain-containing protein n=1 Tax=Lophiostoma macrostomum CBS 122681 TaxID=1314788 RepID=A0A6A6T2I1_9PLEO|nr:hypothetical protein K491DRAFT_693990 [Lophiostoma macrostomum CBS 122681]
MSSSTTNPFRFLDLPKELRLMVYEFMPVTTRHHALVLPDGKEVVLIVKSLSVCLLSTCRLISEEAHPIVEDKLRLIKSTPPRIIFHSGLSMMEDSLTTSLLSDICARVDAIEYGTHMTPHLNATSLRHRLKSRGACVKNNWAAELAYIDIDTLSSFIHHAGWHILSDTSHPRLEIGLRLQAEHTRNTSEARMDLFRFNGWASTACSFKIPVDHKTFLLRSDFPLEALYVRALGVCQRVRHNPTWWAGSCSVPYDDGLYREWAELREAYTT